jgi:mRNA interferase RelE/StbE
MKWQISFSKNSLRFLQLNRFEEILIINKIKAALRKFSGEDVNIDIKKLKGDWDGFYRIRDGKLRIIVEFQFDNFCAHIEEIDWRGNAYK